MDSSLPCRRLEKKGVETIWLNLCAKVHGGKAVSKARMEALRRMATAHLSMKYLASARFSGSSGRSLPGKRSDTSSRRT